MKEDRWDPSESVTVRSGWVWRGFVVLSLLAIGVVIIMAANGKSTLAVLWIVIAAGWFAVGMWLWRQHKRLDNR
jgi:hypothetical protein